ncbi:MAG: hypothetical protein H0W96_06015 [Solirubrobacterales bacterium]|nr:hypothetical protein [Solirubrobacterales bacterium]
MATASPDVLAPLTQAAAMLLRSTGGTGMRSLTRRYADALLEGQISDGGVRGFYSGNRTNEISLSTTLRAGIALTSAYRATGDERYAKAVRAVAASATRPAFGLVRLRDGYAMRAKQLPRRFSVALSALASQFFTASSEVEGTALDAFARGALKTVASSQAAVGRWFAYVGGRTPMTLEQWGSTLTSLAALPYSEARGITGAGVTALAEAAFKDDGDVRVGTLTGGGQKDIARALQALASDPTQRQTEKVFAKSARRLVSAPENAAVSAELALAFAIWQQSIAPS